MAKKIVSIKQIAQELNMSHSTVSRALRDHPSISKATKKHVKKKAKQLGYVRNIAAKTIRGEKSNIIGLIIPDIKNEFYSDIASKITQRAQAESLNVVLFNTEDDEQQEQASILQLLQLRARGVIICPSPNITKESQKLLSQMDIIQFVRKNSKLKARYIGIDEAHGLYMATRHLIELGHTKIAYIGAKTKLSTGVGRLKGFRAAIEEFGNHCQTYPYFCAPDLYDIRKSVDEMLQKQPTALVIGGQRITQNVWSELSRLDIFIPEHLSIIGYGDYSWCSFIRPKLTVLSLPLSEMTEACIEHFITAEENQKSSSWKPKLIIRDSLLNLSHMV